MRMQGGFAQFRDGHKVIANVVDNKAFSRIHHDWHSNEGFTVELESGPAVLPTLESVKLFIVQNTCLRYSNLDTQ